MLSSSYSTNKINKETIYLSNKNLQREMFFLPPEQSESLTSLVFSQTQTNINLKYQIFKFFMNNVEFELMNNISNVT